MGFTFVPKGEFNVERIESGQASILAAGSLTVLAEDLKLVGIDRMAALLVDTDSYRIALRVPKEHEAARALSVRTIQKGKGGGDSGRRSINIARAFRTLGLDPKTCAGRHELTTKDDLLIVNLAGEQFDREGAKGDKRC